MLKRCVAAQEEEEEKRNNHDEIEILNHTRRFLSVEQEPILLRWMG